MPRSKVPFAGTKVPALGTKVPVSGTKVPWQKDKCFNLHFSIIFVEQQSISKKPLKDKNAEVKGAICRDKSAVLMDKSAGFRDESAMALRQMR